MYRPCVLMAFWLLWVVPVQAELLLSEAEQRYRQQHPEVSLCVDPDWVPFESVNANGEHEGIAADLLRLIASRAGLQLRLVETHDWDESLRASQEGRCQLLSFLNQSPDRDAWLLFTRPMFTDVNVLISREEHPFVVDLAALGRERLALPRGTSIEERVRRQFPDIQIVLTDSEAQALALVNQRQVELTMRSLTVAAYTIKKEGWFNLKIAGQVPGFDNQFRIGVRKDQPLLRDILDKALASLTPAEVNGIINRHVSIRVETPTDYRLLGQVVAVFALILFSNLFWIRRLRRVNRQLRHDSQTDVLTGLANRSALNQHFLSSLEQASRYKQPLAVLIFDLDHFKRINDQLGHLQGDTVLLAVAGLLRGGVRASDFLGRWGGEEFLVICPQTDAEQARQLAQRICDDIRQQQLCSGMPLTLSAGVAQLMPGEGVDGLLQRADEALYQAKAEGRDRVCLAAPACSATFARSAG